MHLFLHKIIFMCIVFVLLSSPTEGRSHKSSEIIVPIEPSSPYRYLGRFDLGKHSQIFAMPSKTKATSGNGVNEIPEAPTPKVGNQEMHTAVTGVERGQSERKKRDVSPDYNNNIPASHINANR